MLIKDIFKEVPTSKNEYWKYTDLKFLNLEMDSYSKSTIVSNLNEDKDLVHPHDLNSFISLNNVFDNFSYETKKHAYLTLTNFNGLITKRINFITPSKQKHELIINLQSVSDNEALILFLKMNFIVQGELNLTIISNMRNDYSFDDINVMLMDNATVNFTYVSNTTLNKKIFINSQQHKKSRFDFKFRSLVTNNDNIDLTLSSNIIEENCFLNHDIKCVLNKKSTFSCLGEINILPMADNAEAYHYNSTLALSEDIRVNSRPVLKISNGNVQCSHGSPSSYIKDEDRFYMNSRGISKKDADKIYVTSFLNIKNDIIQSLIESEV
jgi:Fe-S cluster assembly scaffold protein SufB